MDIIWFTVMNCPLVYCYVVDPNIINKTSDYVRGDDSKHYMPTLLCNCTNTLT